MKAMIRFISMTLLLLMLLLPGLALGDGQVILAAQDAQLQAQLLGQMLRSEKPGLEPPYSDMYKTYADYFGGAAIWDSRLAIYATDTEMADLQAYAGAAGVALQKVAHSRNELNALALQIIELGEAGQLRGCGGPPAVIPRHNYVDVALKASQGAGLSPAPLRGALGAPASMRRIREAQEYPQREDGAYVLPKSGSRGGRGAMVGFGIMAVACILICIGLYRLYRP